MYYPEYPPDKPSPPLAVWPTPKPAATASVHILAIYTHFTTTEPAVNAAPATLAAILNKIERFPKYSLYTRFGAHLANQYIASFKSYLFIDL